jgi:rhodanese-related sulfurtransferase
MAAASLALSGCSLLGLGGSAQPAVPVKPVGTPGAATPTAAAPAPAAAAPAEIMRVAGGDALAFADNARVINVDTAAQYRKEHVAGAASVPLSSIRSASKSWKKSGRILVTAKRESVARAGAGFLHRRGFTKVAYLVDGAEGWQGDFAGTNPRPTSGTAKLYLFYTTRPLDPVAGAVERGYLVDRNHDAITKYRHAEDRFSNDVTFRFYDISRDFGGFLELVRLIARYPNLRILTTDVEKKAVPIWVLVDRDGHARAYAGFNSAAESPVDGWLVEQSEWPNRPPQLPYPLR